MQTQSDSPPASTPDGILQDAGQGLNNNIEMAEFAEIESDILVSETIQSVLVTSRYMTITKTYCKCTGEVKVNYLIRFASRCKHKLYIRNAIILKC